LAARWLAGDWALPSRADMEAEIRRDEKLHMRHFSPRQRHTMQLDYYLYEYDLRKRVLPAGQARARAAAGARTAADAGLGTGTGTGVGAGTAA
jgi:hypothetical protein